LRGREATCTTMLDREVDIAELGEVTVEAFRHDVLKRHDPDASLLEGGVRCLCVVGHRSVTDVVHELLPVQTQFRHDHVDEGLFGIGEPVERQGHGDLAQGEGGVDLGGFVLELRRLVGGQDEGNNEVIDLGEADGLGGVLHGGVPCGLGGENLLDAFVSTAGHIGVQFTGLLRLLLDAAQEILQSLEVVFFHVVCDALQVEERGGEVTVGVGVVVGDGGGDLDGGGAVLHVGIVTGRGAKVKGDRKNISLSVPPCRGSGERDSVLRLKGFLHAGENLLAVALQTVLLLGESVAGDATGQAHRGATGCGLDFELQTVVDHQFPVGADLFGGVEHDAAVVVVGGAVHAYIVTHLG